MRTKTIYISDDGKIKSENEEEVKQYEEKYLNSKYDNDKLSSMYIGETVSLNGHMYQWFKLPNTEKTTLEKFTNTIRKPCYCKNIRETIDGISKLNSNIIGVETNENEDDSEYLYIITSYDYKEELENKIKIIKNTLNTLEEWENEE